MELMTRSTSVNDWYGSLMSTLRKDEREENFLQFFKSCKSDEERIKCLLDLPAIHDIISVCSKYKPKSAEESFILRVQGNTFFQKHQNKKALDCYNQSVLSAPYTGETTELALALANRSAVLLHMKYYQLCLVDISFALGIGYPGDLNYKLYERKGKCLYQLYNFPEAIKAFEEAKLNVSNSKLDREKITNLINSYDEQIDQSNRFKSSPSIVGGMVNRNHGPIPILSGERNMQIPCASETVKIQYSEFSGRGLRAVSDIQVGEVLIVEKPYVSTVLPNYNKSHCQHCCNRVISSVPCKHCSGVVYCSIQCQEESWNLYHYAECSYLDLINESDIQLGHLALRMVLKAGYKVLEKCTEMTQKVISKSPDSLGCDENGVYHSDDYNAIYNLVTHTENRSVKGLMKKSLGAIFLLKCIEQSAFFESDVCQSDLAFVGGHILHQMQMLPCNAHEVSELFYKQGYLAESFTQEIGSAIYATLSLINHSCDPSVTRHSYGNICVVRAIRNIPKGKEILDNYGVLYPLTSCPSRRTKLNKQYFFICNCLACQDDWPLYLDIPYDAPVYKCEKCLGPVFVPNDGQVSSSKCSACHHVQDLTKKMYLMARSDEVYKEAMQTVLTGGNLDEAKLVLEKHLRLMDKLICRPWRDYNDCQEALKQCYAVNASCHSIG
ncbi:hypothetical protein ACJMK2_020363 [Sinanodonta woodiana]|uniref:Protein-lysine N-methyltransferase SMYD4 n=1 Tax=Sinanodonta woodiana TaxID=1069815 RepID=A0ABD3U1K5_SINWO